jgi:hypothetical protein
VSKISSTACINGSHERRIEPQSKENHADNRKIVKLAFTANDVRVSRHA